MKLLLIVVFMLPVSISAKDRNWLTGMLVDQQSHDSCRVSGHVADGYGHVRERCFVTTEYTITSNDMLYVSSTSGRIFDVTINDPVQFALDNDNLYLLDSRGKKHKMHIVKRRRLSASADGDPTAR